MRFGFQNYSLSRQTTGKIDYRLEAIGPEAGSKPILPSRRRAGKYRILDRSPIGSQACIGIPPWFDRAGSICRPGCRYLQLDMGRDDYSGLD